MSHAPRSALSLALLIFSAGCGTTRQLAPPPAPAHELPWRLMRHEAPHEGMGLVALDITDGRGRADLVIDRDTSSSAGQATVGTHTGWVSSSGVSEHRRLLCATPCVSELPVGSHEVRFTGKDGRTTTLLVEARREPQAVRVTLPRYEPHADAQDMSNAAMWFGFIAAAVGGGLWGLRASKDGADNSVPEAVTLSGVALLATGILANLATAPTYRPGAATQFDARITAPEPAAPAARVQRD